MATSFTTIVAAGQMRERVLLQACAVSVDAYGDPAYAWSNVATVWARVEPAGGAVETLGDRRTEVSDYDVTIRWRDGISAAQRLVWRGRYLQIESVSNPDERHRRVRLACRDVGPVAGITP